MSTPFAIVTGASAGIGLELAALCAEQGFDLSVAADRPEIHQAADRFRGLRELDGAAIVYAATVKHVEQIHALLRQEGVLAVSYHGRMHATERAAVQDAFMNGVRRAPTSETPAQRRDR